VQLLRPKDNVLSASPGPRHDVLVVGKMMAGDWGWRKERYPLHAAKSPPSW
jgi:hypothetical protein